MIMIVLFIVQLLSLCSSFTINRWHVRNRHKLIQPSSLLQSASLQIQSQAPHLLPTPPIDSVGNFIDDKTDDASFIQCNLIAIGEVDGNQYGVGFPIDMPVMLTYFEDNELKPVLPDYPDYDHLINHVSIQLDGNDFQLYNTPIVLTLQGEFEDEEFNQVNPFEYSQKHGRGNVRRSGKDHSEEREDGDGSFTGGRGSSRDSSRISNRAGGLYLEEDFENEEESEEVTLAQLLATEEELSESSLDEEGNEDDDDDDEEEEDVIDENSCESECGDDDDSNNNEDMASFWSGAPAAAAVAGGAGFTLVHEENPDISSIPPDAFVTAEDTTALKRAHKRADKIIDYAADIKLIASFHYKKRNFHLVRLLEVSGGEYGVDVLTSIPLQLPLLVLHSALVLFVVFYARDLTVIDLTTTFHCDLLHNSLSS